MTEKWDVHTHTTLAPDTYDALAKFDRYTDFIRVRAHATKPCCAEMVNSKGKVQRVVEQNAYDGATRMHECDKHGVTRQVLSPTPMMIPDYVDDTADAAEICTIINDGNTAIANVFPDRFTALAALPMNDAKAAIKELERAKALGMHGVELNSNINGRELDDVAFFPIFEALAAHNMAVFIHPWGGVMNDKRMERNWRAWLIGMGTESALAFDAMLAGRIHERLPKLRVLYSHGGGSFPGLIGRMSHGQYCRPDLFTHASQKDSYATVRDCAIYADSLTHDANALKLLADTLGVERIAMGSDYPYPLGELDVRGEKGIYPGHLIEHHPAFSAVEKARMLAGTAKEWLAWN